MYTLRTGDTIKVSNINKILEINMIKDISQLFVYDDGEICIHLIHFQRQADTLITFCHNI